MHPKATERKISCGMRIALSNKSPDRSSPETRLKDLYAKNSEFLRRMLRRRGALEGDIDDLTQRVFYIAYLKLDLIEEGSERAFLQRIAFYELGHLWRLARRRSEVGDEGVEAATTESTRQDELVSRRRAFASAQNALEHMASELGDVFRLHDFEGRTSQDIAKSLELPLGTVKTRLRKARQVFCAAVAAPPSSH